MKFDQLVFLVFFIMVIKECYGCEGPLGMESGKIDNSQITASSYYGTFYYPWNGRLHMKSVPEENGGAWASAGSYYAPHWVQIDLGSVKKVTAIATQGHPDKGQWIKTFQISSGNDPNSLTLYDNGKIFTGNTDSNTVVKNIFDPPIEARYIRVLMMSWQWWPAIRIELYGITEYKALGMESGEINNSQITASSYYGTFYYPWNARLHMKSVPEENGGAWASAGSYYAPHWVQIDLGSVKKVTAIATQGHPDKGQWIKTFQVSSGNDPNSLTLYDNGKIFTGNTDSNTVVKNIFDPPIEARYIRVLMMSWQWWPAIRIELYECPSE